ncbi:DEAD/DEAH box helicase family protein [Deefgea rivuli]|uniref:DEAD/DEAH box helicase family protein n=1 Tax=Deefgea rivuli TaxID=400948 RepID=UPI000AC151D4|nr:DEAD/DEAH box helicase family protein [Deefgea rivuli]
MTEQLSDLKKDIKFSSAIEKVTLNKELSEDELVFVLSCAILFLNEFAKDKRRVTCYEIAYFIIMKVAISNRYYDPLLDISSNFGLYPISKHILDKKLIENASSLDFALDYKLDRFRNNNIIETYEQSRYRQEIVASENNENCYVAPTSFGKSSLMVDVIKGNTELKKVAIIVPTKSLLAQTYKSIKKNFPQKRIIFHDEMYDGADEFLSILTQERALRLLKNQGLSFDLLIIDEAHNLFEKDSRSILLTRLIRRNRHRNPKSRNYYLSPLISDANNLKINSSDNFFERRIASNIKEPDIHEYRKNGDVYKYNRFMNSFYLQGKKDNSTFIDYITNNCARKNFLYLMAPRKVEELASDFAQALVVQENVKLDEIANSLSNNIHADFYCVDYIRKRLGICSWEVARFNKRIFRI